MKQDFTNLINTMDQLSVGFESFFRGFPIQTSTYPPHNIIKNSETEMILEMAVAGFKKNEIKLEENEGVLTITGDRSPDLDYQYQYRGLASRSFSRSFRIAEFYDVTSAKLEDGILQIVFTKNVPPESQSKVIPIK